MKTSKRFGWWIGISSWLLLIVCNGCGPGQHSGPPGPSAELHPPTVTEPSPPTCSSSTAEHSVPTAQQHSPSRTENEQSATGNKTAATRAPQTGSGQSDHGSMFCAGSPARAKAFFTPTLYLQARTEWLPQQAPEIAIQSRQGGICQVVLYRVNDALEFFLLLAGGPAGELSAGMLASLDVALQQAGGVLAPHLVKSPTIVPVGHFMFLHHWQVPVPPAAGTWQQQVVRLPPLTPGVYLVEVACRGEAAFVWLISSQLKLLVRRYGRQTLIWAVNLAQNHPAARQAVLFGNPHQLPLNPGQTDDCGVLVLSKSPRYLMVYAQQGPHVAYVACRRKEAPPHIFTTDRRTYHGGESIRVLGQQLRQLCLTDSLGKSWLQTQLKHCGRKCLWANLPLQDRIPPGDYYLQACYQERMIRRTVHIIADRPVTRPQAVIRLVAARQVYRPGEVIALEVRPVQKCTTLALKISYLGNQWQGEGQAVDRLTALVKQGQARFFFMPPRPGCYRLSIPGCQRLVWVGAKVTLATPGMLPECPQPLPGKSVSLFFAHRTPKLLVFGGQDLVGYRYFAAGHAQPLQINLPQTEYQLTFLQVFTFTPQGLRLLNWPLETGGRYRLSLPEQIKVGKRLTLRLTPAAPAGSQLALWAVRPTPEACQGFYHFVPRQAQQCKRAGQFCNQRYQQWSRQHLARLFSQAQESWQERKIPQVLQYTDAILRLDPQATAAYALSAQALESLGSQADHAFDVLARLRRTCITNSLTGLTLQQALELIATTTQVPLEIFPGTLAGLKPAQRQVQSKIEQGYAAEILHYLLGQRNLAYKIEQGHLIIYPLQQSPTGLLDRLDRYYNEQLKELGPSPQFSSNQEHYQATAFWHPWSPANQTPTVTFTHPGAWQLRVLLATPQQSITWRQTIWVYP